MTSLTYNDGGRNWDDMAWYVPEGESMLCAFPLASVRLPMNDTSLIRMLMFVFPDNEIDAVYRIDAIQAVYDPVEGSPAETLLKRVQSVKKQLAATESAVNWPAVPAKIRDDVQPKVPQYRRQIDAILAASRKGVQDGLKGQHNSHKRQVEVIARQLGKLVLADKKDFYAWEISRYSNIYRDERPDLASLPLESVDVTMAMDEFRDKVFMVNSCGKDVRLAVEIHPSPDLPAKVIQVRQSLYFRFKNGQEELGDALYDLDGPLEIPRDQSRQVWLTFDTRFSGIKPGEYHFDVVLRDLDTGTQRSVLGRLRIWDFTLPNYDILANNGYVEFFHGEVGLKVRDKAVTQMKRYGLNMVFIY